METLRKLNDFPESRPSSERRIVVLLSGGVDSSVTAWLLREEGWSVTALHMRIPMACGNALDDRAAVQAAEYLRIPLYQIDLTETFHREIIERFQRAYQRARTPNPCVDCNARLKFTHVWDAARRELDIDHLATGHYAITETDAAGRTLLRAAESGEKDQSYFVYGIPRERLPFIHFPLGRLPKTATREIARRAGLPAAEKADSMELCFAGGGDYRTALPKDLPCVPGDFVNLQGEKIGTHGGVPNYTVGQRKLGVSLGPTPHYVLRIFPQENRIVAGSYDEALQTTVTARLLVVHQPEKLRPAGELIGKIRSGAHGTPCRVTACDFTPAAAEADEGPFCGNLTVEFSRPVFAPTPGQHLVVYDDAMAVVAGGVID